MTRAYGGGSVHQRADGRWVAQVRDPRQQTTTQKTARSRREAEQHLRDMRERIEAGRRPTDRRTTFEGYATEWLAHWANRGRSGGTVAEYERILRKDVFPRIGHLRLGEVSEIDVEDVLYAIWQERDLSRAALNQVKKAIASVLTDAVRSKAITVNVARDVIVPIEARAATPADIPTIEEVQCLLQATKGTALGRLLVVLTCSGARIGEALGATWDSIDFETGEWCIERTTSVNRQGKVVLGDHTKTRKSRTLVLPSMALEALAAQRKYCLEMQLISSRWQDNNLMFPSERGTVIDSRNLRKPLQKAKAQAEKLLLEEGSYARPYPGSFHSLRHFFSATSLSEMQAADVQQLLGHSTLRMTTSVYGHLTRRSAIKGAAIVQSALGL